MTKEEILQAFDDINFVYNDCTKYDTLKRMLEELTADVVEVPGDYNGYKDIDSTVKKTRWQITIDNGFKMYTCPECECRMIKNHYDYAVGLKGFNYCPYCGAKMNEREDGERKILPKD